MHKKVSKRPKLLKTNEMTNKMKKKTIRIKKSHNDKMSWRSKRAMMIKKNHKHKKEPYRSKKEP